MTSATDATARQAEIQAYAAAVRAALADVPAERSEELLEDLEEHLAEVGEDGDGGSLEARLGPPADYARELRTAAGLPAGPDAHRPGRAEWVGRLRSSAWVRKVEAFLPELRPAWWVVRAWAALTAIDLVFVGGTSFPLPTLGLGPFGLVATAAAIVWSVRLGLRSRAGAERPGRLAAVVNTALGVATVVAVVGLADRSDVASAEPVSYDNPPPGVLTHDDGTPITNIHPYSSTGEPLTGVLLYDQNGRPIDDLANWTADGGSVERVPDAPPQPDNAYPQPRQVVTMDQWGEETTVPMPTPTTRAPATTGPSSGPAAVPTPTDPAATSTPAAVPTP
jgi:hypothetical protein